MTLTADFDANSRGITESQTVRFVDKSSDTVYTLASWDWDFGDGTAHGTTQTPLHTYPAVVSDTSYTVVLVVTNTNGDTATKTRTRFIRALPAAGIAAPVHDGIYNRASILIYNSTSSVLLNRTQILSNLTFYGLGCNTYIDKIGNATFKVFNDGTATAAHLNMLAQGNNVAILLGKTLIFSGQIKRSVQTLQPLYGDTTRVEIYNVECEDDSTKLKNEQIPTTTLPTSGTALMKPVGDIAQNYVLGTSWSGYIDITDAPINYQLNSSTAGEDAGSKYSHMVTLQQLSNYDMRSRLDHESYDYTGYSSSVITIAGAAFTTNEFAGYYLLFTNDASTTGILAYGKVISNTATTITCTIYNSGSIPTTGTILILKLPKVDFAKDISPPSKVASYNVNDTVFGFNEKEDNKKAFSKVTVKGKDFDGKTISVTQAAVHKWDNTEQFFSDSTYITRKTEGKVYKNSYTTSSTAVTVYPTYSDDWTPDSVFFPTYISTVDNTKFPVGSIVYFTSTGAVPTPLRAYRQYYVLTSAAGVLTVSDAVGGTAFDAISITDNGSGTNTVHSFNWFAFSNTTFGVGEYVFATASTIPTGMALGTQYKVTGATPTGVALVNINNTLLNVTTSGASVKLVKVLDAHNIEDGYFVWLYGWGYDIPSGTALTMVVPYTSSYATVTTSGAGSEITLNNITKITRFALTNASMANLVGNFDFSSGDCMFGRIYVKNKSKVYTSGSVNILFGEETIYVTGSGTHTTYGDYLLFDPATRIMSTTAKHYPHGVGATVSKTNYTEGSPETDSAFKNTDTAHPLQIGPLIETATVDNNIDYGMLDLYATQLLVGNSYYYTKAKCFGNIFDVYKKKVGLDRSTAPEPSQIDISCPPEVGDRVEIIEYTGATPKEYQIVTRMIDTDGAAIMLELGDYEKTVFLLVSKQTAALNRTVS